MQAQKESEATIPILILNVAFDCPYNEKDRTNNLTWQYIVVHDDTRQERHFGYLDSSYIGESVEVSSNRTRCGMHFLFYVWLLTLLWKVLQTYAIFL